MNKFRFHFAIGLHALATLLLLVVLLVFPFAIQAQESSTEAELPAWALGLPTVLIGLVTFNFKTTEAFKRMLESARFGYVPPKDVQGVIVLLFSVILGIVSAIVFPNSTSWLGDMNPMHAYVLTGFSVSVVGGMVYELIGRLNTGTVYKTSTTINTPKDSTSDSTAKETMKAVAESVKS